MTDIRRLYARRRGLLQDYLKQVIHELEGLRYNRGLSQIHSIKGRVKSASAVLDKLHRKGLDWSGAGIDALSHTMPDIIGTRIICLFRDDVDQVVELLTSEDGLPFEVVDREEWVWGRDWAQAVLAQPGMPEHMKHKVSGYTSLHFVVKPTCPPFDERFEGLLCELQVRTILEEAWAEAEHMTAYKKYASEQVREQFQVLSDQLHAVERLMTFVYRQVQGERRAQEVEYRSHIARSYEAEPPSLPEPLARLWRQAYEERARRNHIKALRIHRRMIEEEELVEQYPNRATLNEVVCELGFDHLLIGDHDSLQKAFDLYQGRVLQEEPDNFWATFRLSHIHYHWGLFQEALTSCDRALGLLDELGGCIPRYDCRGLRADALSHMSECTWQLARSAYKHEHPAQARGHHMAALRLATNALQHALDEDATREIIRARNNLAYYCVQRGGADDLRRAEALLDDLGDIDAPLVLTTRALLLFRRGEKEQAVSRIRRAWDLVSNARDAPYAVSSRVKQYLYLLLDDVNGIQPFEFKEFH